MAAAVHRACHSAAMPMLCECRPGHECDDRCYAEKQFSFHFSSLLTSVLVSGLAQVHAQVETKAVQVISNAAGKANLHSPHGRGIESHPAVEAVFTREAGAAAHRRQVKAIFAFAAAALPLAHDLAEDLLVAERENLIAGAAHGEVLDQFELAPFFHV